MNNVIDQGEPVKVCDFMLLANSIRTRIIVQSTHYIPRRIARKEKCRKPHVV